MKLPQTKCLLILYLFKLKFHYNAGMVKVMFIHCILTKAVSVKFKVCTKSGERPLKQIKQEKKAAHVTSTRVKRFKLRSRGPESRGESC